MLNYLTPKCKGFKDSIFAQHPTDLVCPWLKGRISRYKHHGRMCQQKEILEN